jgi:hypothetical protein
MTNQEHDPMLERAIAELKRLPAVNPLALRQVIEAAATARVTPADEPSDEASYGTARRARFWGVGGAAMTAIAAAAAIVGFMARGAYQPHYVTTATVAAAAPAASMLRPVADVVAPGVVKPLLHQFVFENKQAGRISVVGDFNQWNPVSAPMTRSADGSLWSVLVPMLPGRHVYAFMVDDSLLVLDPAQATARDPDLGTNASVVMVGSHE